MYRRTLKVVMSGIEGDAVAAIGSVEPPARFTFELSCADALDLGAARDASVVIAGMDAIGNLGLASLAEAAHDGVGFRQLIVVASPEQADAFSEADLALVDAIWPAPLSPTRAKYEFEALVNRAKQHADLFIAGAYLDTLIDSMPDMVWFKAIDGEHVKVNEYFCEIVDRTRDDVEGQFHNYIWRVPEEDWEKAELTCKASDDAAIEAGTTIECEENVSTHGEIRLFETFKTPVYDEDGSVLGTSGFATDVTLERELKQLAWLNARTDYLTDLYNRRYFYEYLDEHAGDGLMTFALVDLDNFKDINDDSGHDEGDNALLVTTAALHKCFPDCPIVRWGGDEFIAVIPPTAPDLASDANMELFQSTLQEWTSEKCPIALSASIGIATQTPEDSVDRTVKKADDALYRAKNAGKACHRRSS